MPRLLTYTVGPQGQNPKNCLGYYATTPRTPCDAAFAGCVRGPFRGRFQRCLKCPQRNSAHSRSPHFLKIRQNQPHPVRKWETHTRSGNTAAHASPKSDRISPILSENGDTSENTVKPRPREKPPFLRIRQNQPHHVRKRDEASTQTPTRLMYGGFRTLFFLSGLYMARAPRYPRYGRCNSAPRTRHITFQVPHISHLAFPRPMNLPYIGEITSRQPLLRSAPHNRNPNIRQSHHTRPTSAPYHTTITHIPRKHSEKCRRFLSPIPRNPWGRIPPYYRKRQLMAIAGNPQRRQPMPLPSQVPQPAVIASRPQADTTQQPKTTK